MENASSCWLENRKNVWKNRGKRKLNDILRTNNNDGRYSYGINTDSHIMYIIIICVLLCPIML